MKWGDKLPVIVITCMNCIHEHCLMRWMRKDDHCYHCQPPDSPNNLSVSPPQQCWWLQCWCVIHRKSCPCLTIKNLLNIIIISHIYYNIQGLYVEYLKNVSAKTVIVDLSDDEQPLHGVHPVQGIHHTRWRV